jgi:aspartyl-tRNA synthetase
MSKYRTFNLSHLTQVPLESSLKLAGWIKAIRNHAKVLFLDLQDGTGELQCVVKLGDSSELFERVKHHKISDLVSLQGYLRARASKCVSTGPLGHLEFTVQDIELISRPHCTLDTKASLQEHTRFTYRYLDLRNPESIKPILLRSWLIKFIHRFFDRYEFTYVDTPILTSSTPEGARDFLVLSRNYPGQVYALAQSPQMFKQMLMTAGLERYYQLARCFRDEDLRANRQPEFTQVDLEMAWTEPEELRQIITTFITELIFEVTGVKLADIASITYQEALSKYGSDAPDLSIEGLLLHTHDGCVSLCVEQPVEDTSVYLSLLTKGVALQVSQAYTEHEHALVQAHQASEGATIFYSPTLTGMDKLRAKLAQDYQLIKPGLHPIWVVEFPMFEQTETGLTPAHHPFTQYHRQGQDPSKWIAEAYDIVINGQEVGGGSLRITDTEELKEVFKLIGYTEDYVVDNFKFFLEALDAGTPPSCGLALGLERLLMILLEEKSIRQVIAFPKSQSGQCYLTGAPLTVTTEQLRELGLKLSSEE